MVLEVTVAQELVVTALARMGVAVVEVADGSVHSGMVERGDCMARNGGNSV